MKLPVALTIAMIPTLSMANCITPWQTQFSCDIRERNARAEFCRIAEPRLHQGWAELYYTFVIGTQPAELYFESESYVFSAKKMDSGRPSEITGGIGYPHGNYVYAFFITGDRRKPGNARCRGPGIQLGRCLLE